MHGFASLSGGVFYHYLGFRYSSNLWRPARDFISEQLKTFLSYQQQNVLLVGPSASYLLDERVLKSIPHLNCVDIDPLAQVLFQRRHTLKCNWIKQNVFSNKAQKLDIGVTEKFLISHSQSTIVFCNILGQLPFLYPKTWKDPLALAKWKQEFLDLLEGRSVFSFHDRLTLTGEKPTLKTLKHPHSLANNDLISKVSTKSSEIIDHETAGIVNGANNTYCVWSMTPTEHHILECVY